MPIKRNKRFHAEVATSSLSDIMFFYCCFFDNFNISKSECHKNDIAQIQKQR